MSTAADPYFLFQDDLRPGEKLLWTGQPNPNRIFSAADGCAMPFSLMWGGFAFYWEFMVVSQYLQPGNNMPIIMPLWGIPFCLVGLYLIFGRFIALWYQRKATYYAVTDQRLIFLVNLKQRKVQYVLLDKDLSVQKNVRADGSGTLLFGTPQMPPWLATAAAARQNSQMPAFTEIPDADEVAHLIDRRQAALPQSAQAAG